MHFEAAYQFFWLFPFSTQLLSANWLSALFFFRFEKWALPVLLHHTELDFYCLSKYHQTHPNRNYVYIEDNMSWACKMPPKLRFIPLGMYETAVTQTSLSNVWEKDVATATTLINKLQTLLSTYHAMLTALQSTRVLTICHKHNHAHNHCLAYKTLEDDKKARVCCFTLLYANWSWNLFLDL